jgi:hypothetical protein
MKKFFAIFIVIVLTTIIFSSCNKDSTVTQGTSNTGTQTQTFTSNPNLNKIISNSQPVFDTINANITDNILSNNISDVKITLGDVAGVEVDKIKFSLIHGGTEVMVIDALTKTGAGNFTGTVLWDSATTPIDQGQSPYTGTFKPQHLLNSFVNSDPAGQWIIKIIYRGTVKSGVIKSWGIAVSYRPTAQIPTITSAHLPVIGNSWSYRFCDTNISIGATGENITWDYSNLNILPDIYTDEYIDANSSPLHWHFPKSNIAVRNFQLNGSKLEFYDIHTNPGSLIVFGFADSTQIGLDLWEYLHPFNTFNNSVTYRSMLIDSSLTQGFYQGIHTSSGAIRDTVLADGWGKIILPNGITYNNVLRVYTSVHGNDTLPGNVLRFYYQKNYRWITTGFKFPVFEISIYLEYRQGQGASGEKQVLYTTTNIPINKE